MISCVCWVPTGAAKENPDRHELSPEELEQLIATSSKLSINDQDEDTIKDDGVSDSSSDEDDMDTEAKSGTTTSKEDELLKSLNMDNYDDEAEGTSMLLVGQNLTVYQSNNEDPYITVPDEGDVSDEEDVLIRKTDAVLLIGKTEDEHSNLEVHIYEEKTGSLYVHHDFPLPSFPLCMEWVGCDPRKEKGASGGYSQGSFVAVGTFSEGIEIWNLDVLDVMEPVCELGGRLPPSQEPIKTTNKKKKKKNKKKLEQEAFGQIKEGSHTDAVMCLSWSKGHMQMLASGSADKTIKLWDITTQQCKDTLTHHTDKVQALQWNPAEASVLASGGYDKCLKVCDIRVPGNVQSFTVDADMESICWNPHSPIMLAASTESGLVTIHDVRNIANPLATLHAHDKATTAICFNPVIPVLATASVDKTVKLWGLEGNKPQILVSRDMKIGSIFAMKFNFDYPSVISVGGDEGAVAVWDTMDQEGVSNRFRKA